VRSVNNTGQQQGNIFWLSSYPKSGNTWVRAFIANLCHEDSEPVDINRLNTGDIASSRQWVESALNFDIHELTHDEIDRLRPQAYLCLSQKMTQPLCVKIHDAYTLLPDGTPLVPAEASRGALCIVRNPLDVAVSFAHHCNCSIDLAIEHMGNPDYAFADGIHKSYPQLRQKLLTWSEHVNSWLDADAIPCLWVKYEDMKFYSCETFTRIARFLRLNHSPEAIQNALDNCDIKRLQAQEAEAPFRERRFDAPSFFRKGITGDWKTALSKGQVNKVIADHGEVMTRLGYLNSQGNVTEITGDCVLDKKTLGSSRTS